MAWILLLVVALAAIVLVAGAGVLIVVWALRKRQPQYREIPNDTNAQTRQDSSPGWLKEAIEERSPPAPATAAYNPGFTPLSPQELAAHFPQLEIIELLGKGGMGAVYKARQPHLNRFIALKVLPPDAARDSAFAERFAREARALARLNHPHIVTVHDFGESGGLFFLLMEFVDGVNLRQAMRSGQLTPQEALRIVPQLCEALQFAHDEGVVHRDIKPENILLDKRGRVKVADFGLAKLLGQAAGDVSLTGTQQVMGTMHYMAPEQLAGAKAVDHRADIYSLGVTFYEMLTGNLPLGHFPPPSKTAGIDARLDQVVLRTLEREPADRYQHASEVKTDVESISHGHPTTVAPLNPPSAAGMPAKPKYAHWVGIPAVVLAGLYVLLGIGMCMLGNLHLISIPLPEQRPNARIFGGVPTTLTLIWVGSIMGAGLVVLAAAVGVLNLIWMFQRRRQAARYPVTPGPKTRTRVAAAMLLTLGLCGVAWLVWFAPWATPLDQRLVGKWKGTGRVSIPFPVPGNAAGRETGTCTVSVEFNPDGTYRWTEVYQVEGRDFRWTNTVPLDPGPVARWESLGAHGNQLRVRWRSGDVSFFFQGEDAFSMELPNAANTNPFEPPNLANPNPLHMDGTIHFKRRSAN